ncbi:MAG: S8 family serine peptidase [Actinomycetota bacterium]
MRKAGNTIELREWRMLGVASVAKRILPGVVALIVAALVVQPPVEAAAGIASKADPALYAQAAAHPSQTFPVIVREAQPGSDAAESLVRMLGGRITHELRIVGGFSARVPGSAVRSLSSSSLVWRVWGDGQLNVTGTTGPTSAPSNTVWRQVIGLNDQQVLSYNGAGIGVALVDTGVVPVPDLVNHITHVVDFTPEDNGLDSFGHGTHMAGLIAGDGTSSNGAYVGAAPGANLISLKVAGANGATDVSVVMAALQWAVTHKVQYNIRVLNLSFGTDSKQSYSVDPLDYAMEQTWRAGIFVVVAAGNKGPQAGTISKPGDDPYVFTVGAANLNGTTDTGDDYVADFSSRGPTVDGFTKPDVFAPGVSLVSLRDPGWVVDTYYPEARVGDSYFKGTGTSQATALMSGIAALLLQSNPATTNDGLKAALMGTANSLSGATGGIGIVHINGKDGALAGVRGSKYSGKANYGLTRSTGLGSLELSRGSLHVYSDILHTGTPVAVVGEVDALGNAWSGNAWSGNAWSGNAWSSNAWSGMAWEGNAWSGNAWSGVAWSGNAWSGMGWDGNAWSGNTWNGNAWSGNAWSGNAWSGNAWSGNAWSGNAWSGNAWSGNAWSDTGWN